MRKSLNILLLIVLMVSLLGNFLPADAAGVTRSIKAVFSNIKIFVDGKALETSQEPFIIQGTTFVPLRDLGEAIGAQVHWDGANNTIQIARPQADQNAIDAAYQKGYSEGFAVGQQYGEQIGYQKGLTEGQAKRAETAKKDYEKGYEDGSNKGYSEGIKAGEKDFSRGRKEDWRGACPSDKSIASSYNLSKYSADYREGFLAGFTDSFKTGYQDAYDQDALYEYGEADGYDDGYDDGYSAGENDRKRGRNYYWNRDYPKESKIVDSYYLDEESKYYKEGFLAGYKRGYQDGYYDGYYEEGREEDAYWEGYDEGYDAGKLAGEYDRWKGRASNWSNAIASDDELIDYYDLDLESKSYRDNFLAGYEAGFKKGYNTGYGN
jgi:flagellar biosynthesis/type III secretory pathway protein FliH